MIRDASAQSALQRVSTTFRAGAPQLNVIVDRIKAETLGITVGNVFSALAGYVGSTYAAQFNKFGHVFQVYTQALPDYRASVDDIENLKVRAGNGTMTPIGTVIDIKRGPGSAADQPLQSLSIGDGRRQRRRPASVRARRSTSWTRSARRRCRPERATNGPRCPTRRRRSAAQIYFVFGLAMLLVYFVLAGQYESWILPLSVILCVPLALIGTVGALTGLGVANNLYTQIGLILLIALGSKNAILIVEYARQKRAEGMDIIDGGGRGGATQVPADPHDLVRLHSRRLPACHRDRRRRRGAPVDRHRRLQRHDRLDLPRGGVRAVVVRGHTALREVADAW